ncbi:MAG: molybdopterin-dependent oxidoreductase [Cyclobacteriaceae bacterium]
MIEKQQTFCRICESLCGLEVTKENGKIVSIMPDADHVATKGFSCVKGLKQNEMYQSPDRLKVPLIRKDGELVESTWDETYKDIGTKIKAIRAKHGGNSIAMYVGTAAGFGVLHPVFAQGFMTGVGSNNMYSSSTQDCASKFSAARHLYGFPFTQPFPDLEHSECLIIVGANPVVSKWSFLQVPNPAQTLKDMERKGVKIYVVDPRKTETAKTAGEHIFIRPNTDVFFYLSFLNELIAQKAYDQKVIDEHAEGFEELKSLAANWTAEHTAEITGISQEVLRVLVSAYATANGASIYCSTGVNMGTNGTLCFWIQEAINMISGNLDRKGGTLVGHGVMDFIKFGVKNGILMRKDRSRVGDFDSVNDAFPGGLLADEILTPGENQIKALVVTGGNPLITMPNSERLKKAFQSLELLICLDIQPGETCSVATHVLPCTDPLQRPDLPFIFPLMLGLQSKPYLQATEAVLPPEGEQRDEASIYIDLAKHSGINIFGSAVAQKFFEFLMWTQKLTKGKRRMPQEFMLNLILKLTRQPGFKKLLKSKHGWLRDGHKAESFLGHRVHTDSGKVNLAPAPLLKQAEKLTDDFEKERLLKDSLKLITKRAVTTHNSWTHNIERFGHRDGGTNYLYMHSADAEQYGLLDQDMVDVTSNTATVRIPLRLLDDLMPGTVAMPHGWGHQHSGLNVANKATGVNVNILAADGTDNLERVSGMAHLTGIPVKVEKSKGKQQATWSGL